MTPMATSCAHAGIYLEFLESEQKKATVEAVKVSQSAKLESRNGGSVVRMSQVRLIASIAHTLLISGRPQAG
jgi:hypothetical protein